MTAMLPAVRFVPLVDVRRRYRDWRPETCFPLTARGGLGAAVAGGTCTAAGPGPAAITSARRCWRLARFPAGRRLARSRAPRCLAPPEAPGSPGFRTLCHPSSWRARASRLHAAGPGTSRPGHPRDLPARVRLRLPEVWCRDPAVTAKRQRGAGVKDFTPAQAGRFPMQLGTAVIPVADAAKLGQSTHLFPSRLARSTERLNGLATDSTRVLTSGGAYTRPARVSR